MSDRFPGLGFDPAPGDPEQVRRCAREHVRAAVELDSLATAMSSANAVPASWRGAAATAFTAALAPLPAHLRAAAQSFGVIAAQLTAWASELEDLQARARLLERSAQEALDRLRAAHARATVAPAAGTLVASSTHVVDAAQAQEDLRRLALGAEQVRATWRGAGRRVAAAVEAAADAAPQVPRSVGELVWDHRVGIARTANTAAFLSLPSLALPLAGPVVSGALSVVALAGHSALAVHAGGSSTDVALGVAGVGLGGGASLAGRAATGPAGGAAWGVVHRGLAYGEAGAWVIGTTRTLVGAPAPQPPPPVRSSAPALRRLLVAPVTEPPSRKRR